MKTKPGAPTGVTCDIANEILTVSWSAGATNGADTTGYKVEFEDVNGEW